MMNAAGRIRLRVAAVPLFVPGETLQALFQAQTFDRYLPFLYWPLVLIAPNPYRIVVVTDPRILVCFAGRMRPSVVRGIESQLPRATRIGSPRYSRAPAGPGPKPVNRGTRRTAPGQGRRAPATWHEHLAHRERRSPPRRRGPGHQDDIPGSLARERVPARPAYRDGTVGVRENALEAVGSCRKISAMELVNAMRRDRCCAGVLAYRMLGHRPPRSARRQRAAHSSQPGRPDAGCRRLR
jgi:hypothetical protein